MQLRHILLALAIALVWGFNFITMKWGLQTFPPVMLAGVRFLFVAIPCCFFVPFPKIPLRYLLGYAFLSTYAQFSLTFVALNMGLSPGIASVVCQSQVVFTLILSVIILKEIPSRLTWLAIFISSVGLLILGLSNNQDNAPLFGLMAAICAAIAWSVGNIIIRSMHDHGVKFDVLGLTIWSGAFLPIPFFILSYFMGEFPKVQAPSSWPLLIFSVLFLSWISSIFAYTAWGKLLTYYSANVVSPYSLFVPVFGIFFSYLFFGDFPSHVQWLGIAAIIVGILIHALGPRIFTMRKISQKTKS